MKAIVIGGTGHIGTYLIPRLIRLGIDVVNVSRGQSAPYAHENEWKNVSHIALDRQVCDEQGVFGEKIAALDPDIVIDLICFQEESAREIVEALKGRVSHYLQCGSIWSWGYSISTPTTENQRKNPTCAYGTGKANIERYLLEEARVRHFPATIIHPGHIVGPGWAPLNPMGNFNTKVWTRFVQGEKIFLPNFGRETVHHVHADDLAQLFEKAICHWSSAVGEAFNGVSEAAISLMGYTEEMAAWFGQPLNVEYLPWEKWKRAVVQEAGLTEEDIAQTHTHMMHSPCFSMEKARRLLGYAPRYTSVQAIKEAVDYLMRHNQI
jgi:nucleoside-diphosphate-sugar epimerase